MFSWSTPPPRNKLAVIPTYRTELPESVSPFPERKKDFPEDLSWADFQHLLSKFHHLNKLKRVIFSGGEPTLWPHLQQALNICHQKNISTNLITNGQNPIPPVTEKKIYLAPYIHNQISERQILTNCAPSTPESTTKTVYFFTEKDTDSNIEKAIKIAIKLNTTVLLTPKRTAPLNNKIKNLWILSAEKYSQHFHSKLPLPFQAPKDLFTEKQLKLFNQNPLKSCEECQSYRPVINPDGKTVYPCIHYPISSPCDPLTLYKQIPIILKKTPFPCHKKLQEKQRTIV